MSDVAAKVDSKITKDMSVLKRPAGWIYPRWSIYDSKEWHFEK
jgi:hypothetical protein